ncbi:MAG: hypothetical protein CME64_02725 [Halobacteriovoraceae bacterium]|nr:hypothetical protein [Halobacteriovoraceae bacterium]
MRFSLLGALFLFSVNTYAIGDINCERSDGNALLEVEYINDTQAGVSEVSGDVGWAVTATYEKLVLPTKPNTILTRLNLDNGATLKIFELNLHSFGILVYPSGSIHFYHCGN